MAKNRGRNWAYILYEDSLPDKQPDEFLDDAKIPYFLIWHDKDIDEDGKPKKKHAHLVLMFDGNKSEDYMMKIAEGFNCPKPERVENLRSMARYLCHMDNPEKTAYSPDEVRQGYGADYIRIISLSDSKYQLIREMVEWVNANDCRYYSDLFNHCALHNDMWFRALCDNCREDLYRYIYSRAVKIRDEERAAYEFDRVRFPVKHSPADVGGVDATLEAGSGE